MVMTIRVQPRFVEAIKSGAKRQHLLRHNHRRPEIGEELKFDTSIDARYITVARARCIAATPTSIDWRTSTMLQGPHVRLTFRDVEGWRRFVASEGFPDLEAMTEHYRRLHASVAGLQGASLLSPASAFLLVQWDRPRAP